jgi:N-methylhydantoinase A
MDIAVDMGGTFTDAIARQDDGTWIVGKAATTPGALQSGFLAALKEVATDLDSVATLTHGTTVVLNALLTADRPPAVLVTTSGFRDVLEIMRADRKDLFDLSQSKPTPLIPRSRCIEVKERIAADGSVVTPLSDDELDRLVDEIASLGASSVAVCLLFSFRNPEHERAIGERLEKKIGPELFVSLSHEVLPVYREFERTSTTVINAIGRPLMDTYLSQVESTLPSRLASTGFQVMDSSGGLVDPGQARSVPVNTLFSGPAGGVVLGQEAGKAIGRPNVITFDMGGTSTDVAAVTEGRPDRNTYMELAGYPIQVPCLDIVTVGAGGGSIGWVDGGGALLVGPRSAGAVPGPACYGKGGIEPTVTDAAVALGRYNPTTAIGGGLTLDREKAWEAIQRLARKLDLSREETAWGIIQIVNSNMANAIRSVSIERSRDPRNYSLVALGGGGAAHGLEVAAELNMASVLVPAYPGVASAQGMLLADKRRERLLTLYQPLPKVDANRLERIIDTMAGEARSEFNSSDADERGLIFSASLDLRYQGQTHELAVPVSMDDPNLDAAADAFHELHTERYGHAIRDAVIEAVNVRVVAVCPTKSKEFGTPTWPEHTSSQEPRSVYWGPARGWVMTPVLSRTEAEGVCVEGPAIIEQSDATIIIPPGARSVGRRPGFLELDWNI